MPESSDHPTSRRSSAAPSRRSVDSTDSTIALGWAGVVLAVFAAVWLVMITAGDPSAEASASRHIGSPDVGPGEGASAVDVGVTTTIATIEAEITSIDEAALPASDLVDVAQLAELDVRVVGDSLALSAIDELRTAFGSRVRVNAEVGRALNQSMAAITEATFGGPDVVVIALGTNDWDGPADYGDRIDNALSRLESIECVVWVNTQEFRPGLERVNVDIDLAADRHGFHVARWSDLAGAAELHIEDGYHLAPPGQALFADLIAATVATSC